VHELVDHLNGSLAFIGAAAGAQPSAAIGGGPEDLVAATAQQALEAWRRRGLDGQVDLGGHPMPATLVADILSIELLVHAWDLARATGRQIAVSDELSAFVLDLGRELLSPQLRDGDRFAPEVVVGDGADGLARLAAFTGRRP
jgi:uncharacterized protein (TIGR03086 family)